MQTAMNVRIKFRESFRPFAPSVLIEDVDKYFELDRESPYMLLVADVRKELRCELTDQQKAAMKDPDLRKRVNVKRSTIPAVTHVDMSARVQTVDKERHGRFWRLMNEFKRQTGCGLIINTSFNIRVSLSSARRRTLIAASWRPIWTCSCWRTACSVNPSNQSKMPRHANNTSIHSNSTEQNTRHGQPFQRDQLETRPRRTTKVRSQPGDWLPMSGLDLSDPRMAEES